MGQTQMNCKKLERAWAAAMARGGGSDANVLIH